MQRYHRNSYCVLRKLPKYLSQYPMLLYSIEQRSALNDVSKHAAHRPDINCGRVIGGAHQKFRCFIGRMTLLQIEITKTLLWMGNLKYPGYVKKRKYHTLVEVLGARIPHNFTTGGSSRVYLKRMLKGSISACTMLWEWRYASPERAWRRTDCKHKFEVWIKAVQ